MVASLKGSLHGGARRLERTRRARPSYPNTVRCGPGLTASGVRQARALVRCGVNPAGDQDAHEADDARMCLRAEALNRRSGTVPMEEIASAQTLESVQVRNRKARIAEGIEDAQADFSRSTEADKSMMN